MGEDDLDGAEHVDDSEHEQKDELCQRKLENEVQPPQDDGRSDAFLYT